MPTLSLSELIRWRQRIGGRGSRAGLGDMELGRRGGGVVFDNRIVFDLSAASGFDNLTFGQPPRLYLSGTGSPW